VQGIPRTAPRCAPFCEADQGLRSFHSLTPGYHPCTPPACETAVLKHLRSFHSLTPGFFARLRRARTKRLKTEASADLDLPRIEGRRIGERLARAEILSAGDVVGWREKADDIVHRPEIQPIENIESFSHQLNFHGLAQANRAHNAQVHSPEIRTATGVATRERWPIRRGMEVLIQIGSHQKIKRPCAVGSEYRRRRESARTLNGSVGHELMALIKR